MTVPGRLSCERGQLRIRGPSQLPPTLRQEKPTMVERARKTKLRMERPARYRITVQGYLDASWSDRLGGLEITVSAVEQDLAVTQLSGELLDQAGLLGVLNALYNLHYPLISVDHFEDPVISPQMP